MHSISEFCANVPAFLAKLWKMVEDPSTNDLILWSPNGSGFLIRDQARFCKELLPMYYKHNNMASFIRQLNMYGFHKIVSIEAGSGKLEQDEHEFHHPYFIKDHPYMLEHIKRKMAGNRIEGVGSRSEAVNKVLVDVRQMKSRQETMDSRLSQMKLENEALWRELSILRQKHLKQQQIVNKLIQFLVSLVQHPHNNGITVKRRAMPLMLQDKRRRSFAKSEQKRAFLKSPSGPVIHELDPAEYATALLDTVQDEDNISEESPTFVTEVPSVEEAAPKTIDSEIIPDQTIEVITDAEPEEFLMSADSVLTSDISSPESISVNTVPQSVDVGIVKQLVAGKRGRLRKKRPAKSETDQETVLPTTLTNNVQSMIIPNIAEVDFNSTSLPNLISEDVSLPSNYHVTPDTYMSNEECTINFDDLKFMNTTPSSTAAQASLGSSPNTAGRNAVAPRLSLTNKVLKRPITKKYNIGKNASTLFKNKKGKSSIASEKDSGFADEDKATEVSNKTVNECAKLKPNIGISDSLILIPHTEENESEPVENNDMTVACTTESNQGQLNRYSGNEDICHKKVEDVDSHIESMQSELDTLKELLKSESLSLDANALLGLFTNDDALGFNAMDIPMSQLNEEIKENNSNKVAMYNPSPGTLDLNDVFTGNEWTLPDSSEPLSNNDDLPEDIFSELNTPVINMSSPSFSPPAKKKTKKIKFNSYKNEFGE